MKKLLFAIFLPVLGGFFCNSASATLMDCYYLPIGEQPPVILSNEDTPARPAKLEQVCAVREVVTQNDLGQPTLIERYINSMTFVLVGHNQNAERVQILRLADFPRSFVQGVRDYLRAEKIDEWDLFKERTSKGLTRFMLTAAAGGLGKGIGIAMGGSLPGLSILIAKVLSAAPGSTFSGTLQFSSENYSLYLNRSLLVSFVSLFLSDRQSGKFVGYERALDLKVGREAETGEKIFILDKIKHAGKSIRRVFTEEWSSAKKHPGFYALHKLRGIEGYARWWSIEEGFSIALSDLPTLHEKIFANVWPSVLAMITQGMFEIFVARRSEAKEELVATRYGLRGNGKGDLLKKINDYMTIDAQFKAEILEIRKNRDNAWLFGSFISVTGAGLYSSISAAEVKIEPGFLPATEQLFRWEFIEHFFSTPQAITAAGGTATILLGMILLNKQDVWPKKVAQLLSFVSRPIQQGAALWTVAGREAIRQSLQSLKELMPASFIIQLANMSARGQRFAIFRKNFCADAFGNFIKSGQTTPSS